MELFCVAIKRDSDPFLKFPLHNFFQVILCVISLVSCFELSKAFFFPLLLLLLLLFYSLQIFYYKYSLLVVFHWSLSDSKSPGFQYSFLANLNYVFVWIISILLIAHSFSPLSFAFEDHSKLTNYKLYYHCPHVPQRFLFSGKVKVFVYLFAFFYFCSIVY